MGKRKYDLTGKKYNRLTVLEYIKNGLYRCVCDCGKECVVSGTALIQNRTLSCGCYRNERIGNVNRRHNGCGTKLYGVWNSMRTRCENPKDYHYQWYGGRGIKLCEEWHDFKNFQNWAEISGYFDGLSIDRIDCNGDYTPENCKWSTHKEQCNNRRNNLKVVYKGKTLSVSEIAKRTGLSRQAIEQRIHKGMTPEQILETPKNTKLFPHKTK